jgi:hypothetical protein
MLCEDFNSATRTARQYDVDCVTLDGKIEWSLNRFGFLGSLF